MPSAPENQKSRLPSPSPRVTAVLAGVMLAVGVAVGAAIGPAPEASFAGASRLPLLLPALIAGSSGHASSPAAQPPASHAPTPAPPITPSARASSPSASPTTSAATTTSPAPESAPAASAPSPTPPTGAGKTSTLAPVTKVWLIELAGTSFAEASAQPSAAPYLDTSAVPAGTLLGGWSALDGSAFASNAALLASSPPQILDTIVQPPCPEGAAAAGCAVGTPGGLAAADEFLKAALPTITTTAAYRENGLIVITFGTIASATATGLPGGSATVTLTSQPPGGVLVISPFVSAGAHSSVAYDPTSPKQSLEKLLRH